MAVGRTSTAAYYWTISDNGRCRKFNAQRTFQGKDFELILTVKTETRHPVGGLFGREVLPARSVALRG